MKKESSTPAAKKAIKAISKKNTSQKPDSTKKIAVQSRSKKAEGVKTGAKPVKKPFTSKKTSSVSKKTSQKGAKVPPKKKTTAIKVAVSKKIVKKPAKKDASPQKAPAKPDVKPEHTVPVQQNPALPSDSQGQILRRRPLINFPK